MGQNIHVGIGIKHTFEDVFEEAFNPNEANISKLEDDINISPCSK